MTGSGLRLPVMLRMVLALSGGVVILYSEDEA